MSVSSDNLTTLDLSDNQRTQLFAMLTEVLLEIRGLGWQGKSQQAADLADAFHNLPAGMWQIGFKLMQFRNVYLAVYQERYASGEACHDYVAMLDRILNV